MENGALKAGPALPGDTHADYFLQRTTLPQVMTNAASANKDCRDIYVENTKFLHTEEIEAQTETKKAPWDELWTFSVCGEKVGISVRYRPVATGTVIGTTMNKNGSVP